jgi:hypothetical protein
MMKVDDGPLASNAELHGYLRQTAETLTRLGHSDAAMKVRDAAAQSTGLSTGFLEESRNALVEALRSAGTSRACDGRTVTVRRQYLDVSVGSEVIKSCVSWEHSAFMFLTDLRAAGKDQYIAHGHITTPFQKIPQQIRSWVVILRAG